MMYIEHTALEDNLHHILTNRVPTSSSPGATEAAAVAASALLARVREAQNGASSFTALQVPHLKESKFNKEWSRRPEPQLLPVQSLKKLLQRSKEVPTSVLDLTQTEGDCLEEEQYELLHVVDSDQPDEPQRESKISVAKGNNGTPREKIGDNLSTTHFVIDLADAGLQNKTDEEEEFEYVVTRVPRKRNHSQNLQQHLGPHPGQADSQASTSQRHSHGSQRASRPVPGAIPIEYHQRKLHNGSLKPTDATDDTGARGSRTQDYSLGQGQLNGYPEPYVDPEDCNYYLKTAEVGLENHCDNERCKKDAQMGLDILSKLKSLFSRNPPSSDHFNTVQQDSTRKRRSDDLPDDSRRVHMIKYRKVDNHFPKYVAHTEDHDVINIPLAPTAQSSKQFQSNMSARRSTSSIDKPPLRKSMFSEPNTTKLFVKNTPYADIEFSDDDEPIVIKPSTSAAAKHVPKVYKIPIVRTEERAKCTKHRQQPPPLIEPRTGNILTSSMIPAQDYGRKNMYANDVRQKRTQELAAKNGYILGTRNSSISSLGGAYTTEASRLQNGWNSLRTNHWSNIITRSSIVAQERESEQHEKYQQLLEQFAPRLYGSSAENKIPTNVSAQRRRSGFFLGGASSSSRSSSANARRSVGLSQSILRRPPLSSTINLDEDGDDDVTLGGISHFKPSNRQSREMASVPTIILDDDDISDIVELGTAERHVLSQVGKIKQEENSILNLRADKPKKLKNNALPYVEPVNSLKDLFSASPHIKDNWLDNWENKWTLRKRNRLVEVKETAEVAEKFAAERKAAEAEIQERLRRFQIVDPELLVVDDFEDLIPEPEFVELGEEHRASINAAVFGGPPDQVLVSKFNLNITRRDIHTLCGHSWLNDEVINFYMNLLTERGDLKQSQGLPSVYAMNTFFVPRLLQAGHSGVKRWTRKVDIFAKDILPMPVHVGGVHWCMAIIHMKNRTIKYYDSMGTPNPKVLKALEQYLKEESLDKRKLPFDTSGFHIESVQGVPRQMNGSDCGVFSCMFAEYITRNKEITFSQQNMEYFRQKMILEIVTGELLQ